MRPPSLFTDNNPLTYVLSSAKLNATGLRWVGELADINFSIKYRPGKVHKDADTLSPMPLDIESYKKDMHRRNDSRNLKCNCEFSPVTRSR